MVGFDYFVRMKIKYKMIGRSRCEKGKVKAKKRQVDSMKLEEE